MVRNFKGFVKVRGTDEEIIKDMAILMVCCSRSLGRDVGELGCELTNKAIEFAKEKMKNAYQ